MQKRHLILFLPEHKENLRHCMTFQFFRNVGAAVSNISKETHRVEKLCVLGHVIEPCRGRNLNGSVWLMVQIYF